MNATSFTLLSRLGTLLPYPVASFMLGNVDFDCNFGCATRSCLKVSKQKKAILPFGSNIFPQQWQWIVVTWKLQLHWKLQWSHRPLRWNFGHKRSRRLISLMIPCQNLMSATWRAWILIQWASWARKVRWSPDHLTIRLDVQDEVHQTRGMVLQMFYRVLYSTCQNQQVVTLFSMDLPITSAPYLIVKLGGLLNKDPAISPSLTHHGKGSNQSSPTWTTLLHEPQTAGLPDSQNGAPDRVLHEAYQVAMVKFLHKVERKPKLGLMRWFIHMLKTQLWGLMFVSPVLTSFRHWGRIFCFFFDVWILLAPPSVVWRVKPWSPMWRDSKHSKQTKTIVETSCFLFVFVLYKSCSALLIQPGHIICILWTWRFLNPQQVGSGRCWPIRSPRSAVTS